MCRLAALPPGTSPVEAYELLKSLEQNNKDGVGVGYWTASGERVIKKFPISVTKLLEQKIPIFEHLPHTGWTIFHTRLGTHGKTEERNTHPFAIGDYIFCHNGVWSDSHVARAVLVDDYNFEGETDSEVAGVLFSKWGPEKFTKRMLGGGVYMALHRSGELHVVKTTGDLEILAVSHEDDQKKPKGKVIVASEFCIKSIEDDARACNSGYHVFNPDGTIKDIPETREKYKYQYGNGGYRSGYRTTFPGDDDWGEQYAAYERDEVRRAAGQPLLPFRRPSDKETKADRQSAEASLNFWSLDPDNYQLVLIDQK